MPPKPTASTVSASASSGDKRKRNETTARSDGDNSDFKRQRVDAQKKVATASASGSFSASDSSASASATSVTADQKLPKAKEKNKSKADGDADMGEGSESDDAIPLKQKANTKLKSAKSSKSQVNSKPSKKKKITSINQDEAIELIKQLDVNHFDKISEPFAKKVCKEIKKAFDGKEYTDTTQIKTKKGKTTTVGEDKLHWTRNSASNLQGTNVDDKAQALIVTDYNQTKRTINTFFKERFKIECPFDFEFSVDPEDTRHKRRGKLALVLKSNKDKNLFKDFFEILKFSQQYIPEEKVEHIPPDICFADLLKIVNQQLPNKKPMDYYKLVRAKLMPLASSLMIGNNCVVSDVKEIESEWNQILKEYELEKDFFAKGRKVPGHYKFGRVKIFGNVHNLRKLLNIIMGFHEDHGLEPIIHNALNKKEEKIINDSLDVLDNKKLSDLQMGARQQYFYTAGGNDYEVGDTANASQTISEISEKIGLEFEGKRSTKLPGAGTINIDNLDKWRHALIIIINKKIPYATMPSGQVAPSKVASASASTSYANSSASGGVAAAPRTAPQAVFFSPTAAVATAAVPVPKSIASTDEKARAITAGKIEAEKLAKEGKQSAEILKSPRFEADQKTYGIYHKDFMTTVKSELNEIMAKEYGKALAEEKDPYQEKFPETVEIGKDNKYEKYKKFYDNTSSKLVFLKIAKQAFDEMRNVKPKPMDDGSHSTANNPKSTYPSP